MIEINNLTSFRLDKKFFTGVAKKVLTGENIKIGNLSIAFVGVDQMQELNKKYRQKNKPTDVLSFELKEEGIFGEVVICPQVVKENAAEQKSGFNKEMAFILIHGILHLCGYDHEKTAKEAEVMEQKQQNYLSKIKF